MGEIVALERLTTNEVVDTYTAPELAVVPVEERVLLGVDYLLARRHRDGTYSDMTLEAAHVNLTTAVKEMAIPHAISTIYLKKTAPGVYMAGDQGWIDVAESGKKYHTHPAALERVRIEIEEARYNSHTLEPSMARVFISPRMSETDAPEEVARREHLAHDDAIRVTRVIPGENGEPDHMYMEAALVRDIPLDAWIRMLRDPGNLFGKQVILENERSALSVMKVFPELELPVEALPDGVKGLVKAAIPYITDPELRQNVQIQYEKFHANQEEIHAKASSIADRWLAFDVEMAESLHQRRATPYIQQFISGFDGIWGDRTSYLLRMHALSDGGIYMTRELAIKVEEARIKTLWIKAAVANGNETVIGQMAQPLVEQIRQEEARIHAMTEQGFAIHQILIADSSNNHIVVQQEVKGGGGCPGEVSADVKPSTRSSSSESETSGSGRSGQGEQGKKTGKDRILKCVKCPLCKKDGVDARIEYFGKKKRITCGSCKKYKEYK